MQFFVSFQIVPILYSIEFLCYTLMCKVRKSNFVWNDFGKPIYIAILVSHKARYFERHLSNKEICFCFLVCVFFTYQKKKNRKERCP